VSSLKRIAPVFAVRDLGTSRAYYEQLGFETREYEGGGCAFATRDGLEIHLGLVPEGVVIDPDGNIIRFGSPTAQPRTTER